jgi:hypothetical protein
MTDDQTTDKPPPGNGDGELEPQPGNPGGNQFDDPNRQAVGLDPAWVEGTGGGEEAATKPAEPAEPAEPAADTSGGTDELDQKTKAELLEQAKAQGVSPANNDMTKQELIDGIRAAG